VYDYNVKVTLIYDYNVKVMFSLFPSPSGRNQMFNHGKHHKSYSCVYISCGVFGWGSDRKEILDLITAISPWV